MAPSDNGNLHAFPIANVSALPDAGTARQLMNVQVDVCGARLRDMRPFCQAKASSERCVRQSALPRAPPGAHLTPRASLPYAMEVAGVKRAASDAPDEAGAADKLRRVDEGGAAEGAPPIVQQRRTCLHEVMTRTRLWLRIHTTSFCCR